jgi:hypothetical protein
LNQQWNSWTRTKNFLKAPSIFFDGAADRQPWFSTYDQMHSFNPTESKLFMKPLRRNREYYESVYIVPETPRSRYPLGKLVAVACAIMLFHASAIRAEQVELEEVAAFPSQQVTGVTVSATGRVFVNFPFWSDEHTISVAEVVEGKPKPFPDEAWNAKNGPPA